ncbi:hypothetical protein [Pedobacter glucosidilyticus]|uniref:hypothetical protein n=1 Tax=Pedobacter glucosidilyticus TaxID=1122941 RepID=UPI0003F506C9|nr:hypothetical protein [Pedobacter glucosidilyticus]
MKKSAIASLVVLASVWMACNQNQPSTSQTDSTVTPSEDALETQCFTAVVGKDSASMKLNNLDGKISGQLAFNFFEKDDSDGEIKGEFKGDTLFVDYIFKAEGSISKNPLAFLKKDGKLYQGYGEIETYLGKTYFKEPAAINFDKGFVFEQDTCK